MNTNGSDCEDDRQDCCPFNSDHNRIGVTSTSEDNNSMDSPKRRSTLNEYRNWMQNNNNSDENHNNWSEIPTDELKDQYCWDCHKKEVNYSCNTCLRSYHKKCLSLKESETEPQSCPECIGIIRAEEVDNPSGFMQQLDGSVERLTQLLEYTIVTVKTADRNNSFAESVSAKDYPKYLKYIVNPIDLSLVQQNIQNKTYRSTNSFLADIKWIHHNCVVFNSSVNNFALISEAKNVLRVAKQECEEIEICPDCYLNYYQLEDEDTYFAVPCARPHAIVWAKLQGHPYWPSKVVRYNQSEDKVDVRFFGEHDKCWLKPNKCLLMSKEYPSIQRLSRSEQDKLNKAVKELNLHFSELKKEFKKSFKFYAKNTVFTVDKLYLNYDQISSSSNEDSESEVSPNVSIKHKISFMKKEGHKRHSTRKDSPKKQSPNKGSLKRKLNTFDGIPLKKLRVDIKEDLIFDINTGLESNSSDFGKYFYFKGLDLRESLSDYIESDQSYDGSQMDCSFSSNTSFNQKSNSKNDFNDNDLHPNTNEENDWSHSLKCSQYSSQTPIVTVFGKSSQTLKTINSSKTSNHELSDNSKLLIDSNGNHSSITTTSRPSALKPNNKSQQKMKTESNEVLLKRIKSLEFKNRKLEEDLSRAHNKSTANKNKYEELKKFAQELEISIIDIKKKQWCTHCLKPAVLPCCWNAFYCTVECQHQHWSIHSKTCLRK